MLTKKLKPIANIIRGRPVLAIFEVNLTCNSQCGYCDLPLNQGRYELSRKEIKTIFQKLYNEGLRYILLQGGEPTLRKDLPSILFDLYEIGLDICLVTNGTRMPVALIQALEQTKSSISISLDTLDRTRYKLIRGADQLSLVLKTIEKLEFYPNAKYITCVVSELNKQDALDVTRYAREKGFMPVLGAYHWDVERYGKIDQELKYEKESIQNVFQEILESNLVPKGYFSQYIKDNIKWLQGKKLNACDAGRYSISIDSSGNVAPCLALNHSGNLLDNTLDEILNLFEPQVIRSCSDKSSCNLMCSRVIGSNIRNPLMAMTTPHIAQPLSDLENAS